MPEQPDMSKTPKEVLEAAINDYQISIARLRGGDPERERALCAEVVQMAHDMGMYWMIPNSMRGNQP